MSSFKWLANSLKNLRIPVGAGQNILARSPQEKVMAQQPHQHQHQPQQHQAPPPQVMAHRSKAEKPKKPLSPYFRFWLHHRTTLEKQNPGVKYVDLVKVCADKWKALSEEEKASYAGNFASELAEYNKQLKVFRETLPPEHKELQRQLKVEKAKRKGKLEQKQKEKNLGKPKRPLNAFFQFVAAQGAYETSGEGFKLIADKVRHFSEKWNQMSEQEKEPYYAKFQSEREKYEKSLQKWEQEMLKSGHEDMVRQSHKSNYFQ